MAGVFARPGLFYDSYPDAGTLEYPCPRTRPAAARRFFGCVLAMLVTMMGLITPPVGSLIYITAGIAEESPLKVIKELTPFTLALVALVILLIFFPGLVTAFPNWVMS